MQTSQEVAYIILRQMNYCLKNSRSPHSRRYYDGLAVGRPNAGKSSLRTFLRENRANGYSGTTRKVLQQTVEGIIAPRHGQVIREDEALGERARDYINKADTVLRYRRIHPIDSSKKSNGERANTIVLHVHVRQADGAIEYGLYSYRIIVRQNMKACSSLPRKNRSWHVKWRQQRHD